MKKEGKKEFNAKYVALESIQSSRYLVFGARHDAAGELFLCNVSLLGPATKGLLLIHPTKFYVAVRNFSIISCFEHNESKLSLFLHEVRVVFSLVRQEKASFPLQSDVLGIFDVTRVKVGKIRLALFHNFTVMSSILLLLQMFQFIV